MIKMMKRLFHYTLIVFISFMMITLGACKQTENDQVDKSNTWMNTGIENILKEDDYIAKVQNPLTDDNEDFHENDEWKNHVTIYCGQTIDIQNSDTSKMSVSVDKNNNIIVTSSKKMTLTLNGNLNGSITVIKDDGKLKLILDGISISSLSGPAINLQTDKRVFVVINDETINNMTDGIEHPNDVFETKGALFSEEQMIFSGEGTLNITGRHRHGIVSDDYIKILGGKINVISAENDGIHAKDYIVIDGGNIKIHSVGSDGIECDNGYIIINGGIVDIIVAFGDGITTTYEGADINIDSRIEIYNGVIKIIASDDGFSSASDIIINQAYIRAVCSNKVLKSARDVIIDGGYNYFRSALDRAISVKGSVMFTGGVTVALADGAASKVIDTQGGVFAVKGGTLLAAGESISLPDDTVSKQGMVICTASNYNMLYLETKQGDEIIAVRLMKKFATVFLSTSGIELGMSYNLNGTKEMSGNNFFGLYVDSEYSDTNLIKSFTTSTLISRIAGNVNID